MALARSAGMSGSEEEHLSEFEAEQRNVKVISVQRRHVERGDTSGASEELDELIASQNRGYGLQTKVLFRFTGYDSEDRCVHEIPEIRRWFVKLESRYPYLLCLLSGLDRQLLEYVMMFVPYTVKGRKVEFERESLVRFLKSRLRQAASYGGAVGMEKGRVKLRVLRGLGISNSLDDFV